MKQLRLIIMLVFVLATFALCKKEDPGTGPAGAAGATGQQGAPGLQGVAGNANVTQYTYGTHDFSVSNATPKVTTTEDTMNRSAWFVYLVRASGNVYQIPGYGLNASSDYRTYYNFASSKVNFYINKVSGTGEEYTIKIIRIYANTVTAGGRMAGTLPDIDFKNYHAVCDYYQLPY